MDQDKKRIVKIVLIAILIIGVNILFTFLINSLFFKHTEGDFNYAEGEDSQRSQKEIQSEQEREGQARPRL